MSGLFSYRLGKNCDVNFFLMAYFRDSYIFLYNFLNILKLTIEISSRRNPQNPVRDLFTFLEV